MPSQAVFGSKEQAVYTTSTGAPVSQPYAAQRIGKYGPLLLQDFHHIDVLAHFARERIPERVVHAKGAGAHGYIEVTHDITDLTCAALFDAVGNKAPVTVRFSTVIGEAGTSDSARGPRGMGIKIKTEEGNLDWVFNHTPVFFIRDPAKFAPFVHAQKRDPQTHLRDPDMSWDYLSQNPESIHQVVILFSDRGTPAGYHRTHAYSAHAFKFVNSEGKFVYVKIHVINDAGCKTMTAVEATRLAGEDPDFGIKSLFNDIVAGNYPSYTVYIQTMTSEEAENFRYNILDVTKVWPQAKYPLRPVGKIVLNKNPENYFAEVEQAAFAPAHLVPGIEPSADPVLQARLFVYPDAQRYRLGVNYGQLAVNVPVVPVANFQRDGFMAIKNQGFRPSYQSSILPLQYKAKAYEHAEHEVFLGAALADLSEVTELDFEQPRVLWSKVLNDEDRTHLVRNVAGHLGSAKSAEIKARQLSVFAAVDQDLADRIADAIGVPRVQPQKVKPAEEALRFRAPS
ncbi:catalase [Polyporus arcularius HHB13444]|uniref:Catalase n=1 Tax=Polyporus arcularius HHB13444 TaxID=1314778 RepID=A0A5C3PVI3_9APHY|nr:catalase [Polyporus arcularius HHB13444]